MAGKPKGQVMSENEMIEYGKQKRATKIYKAESMELANESISGIVKRGLAEIEHSDNVRKIDLSDVEMVKEVSKQYLKACSETATIPTMAGFARACGCSRVTLYQWMNHRSDTESGHWIRLCHDLFTDVLAETALLNSTNPIVSIFLMKSLYGLQDTNRIEIGNAEYDWNDDSAGNYKDKYRNLIKDQ